MRRILIAVVIILVAWIALKNTAYSSFLGEADSSPDAPDYYYSEAWLDRPETPPPGGWETPWGVDVFVIAPPVSDPAPKGLLAADTPSLTDEYQRFMSGLQSQDANWTVYAPAFRSPSPASTGATRKASLAAAMDDVSLGFKRYLSADNRDRGLLILVAPGSEAMLEPVLSQLRSTDSFRQRFAGIILPATATADGVDEITGSCSPAFDSCILRTSMEAKPNVLRYVLPSLPRPKMNYTADEDFPAEVDARMQALSSWLDENAAKPAEPFDTWAADEVVDVAPIRRPNQEEDISGERGN